MSEFTGGAKGLSDWEPKPEGVAGVDYLFANWRKTCERLWPGHPELLVWDGKDWRSAKNLIRRCRDDAESAWLFVNWTLLAWPRLNKRFHVVKELPSIATILYMYDKWNPLFEKDIEEDHSKWTVGPVTPDTPAYKVLHAHLASCEVAFRDKDWRPSPHLTQREVEGIEWLCSNWTESFTITAFKEIVVHWWSYRKRVNAISCSANADVKRNNQRVLFAAYPTIPVLIAWSAKLFPWVKDAIWEREEAERQKALKAAQRRSADEARNRARQEGKTIGWAAWFSSKPGGRIAEKSEGAARESDDESTPQFDDPSYEPLF